MSTTLQLRRGLRAQLPAEAPIGEPLYCTDTQEMFIGAGPGFPPRKVGGTGTTDIQEINITGQVDGGADYTTPEGYYTPDSLKAWVNGIRETKALEEFAPATGVFKIVPALKLGDTLVISYRI